MRSLLLLLGLLAASWARADVQLVDPTHPFTVAGYGLAPLQVIVRDSAGQPVPGAQVSWYVPMMTMAVALGNMAGCNPDAGTTCSRPADSRGISTMEGVLGTVGTITVRASDAAGKVFLGGLAIPVNVPPPRTDNPTLSVVSGAGQRAIAGSEFPQPFVARLLNSSGDPVANTSVTFFVSTGTRGKFPTVDPAESSHVDVSTDAQGYARSPVMVAGWGLGDGSVEATWGASRVSFPYSITNADGTVFRSFQDLWWSGPGENGWGMSITQHGDQLFSVVFAYDGSGEPTWYVFPGGRWSWGIGSQFGTPAYSPRSSPYYAYDASQFSAGDPYFGGAQIDFHGDEAIFKAVLDANPACVACAKSVTKAITRQPFQSDVPGPARGVSDIWWGGASQNGWGLSITEHDDSLVALWFTYGADGKPTWFVMPGGEWNGSTFSGAMYRTRGSPWLGETYDVSRYGIAQAGTFSLSFADSGHATFSWSIGGRSGSMGLERQPF